MVLFERCLIACALYEEFWIKVFWAWTRDSLLLPPCTSPSTLIITSSTQFKKKKRKEKQQEKKKKRSALSLRVTLICDCICCIRGWPACHTRYDCSICQLLRCIFFVSHYLTETYLIGSMKVLMGLHRKFLKTILSMKQFTECMNCIYRLKMFCFSCLSSSFLFPLSSCLSPNLLSFFSILKYAKYLEGFSTDGARHVYKKACSIHLPKKPAIHLLWAAFEEQQGKKKQKKKNK